MEFSLWTAAAVFLASLLGGMGLGGGSVLLLYLMLFTDVPQITAQAYNLILFLPTAALAILLHRKNGLIRQEPLKRLLPAGIVGGLLGSAVGNRLAPHLLRRLFGVFLLVMGLQELWALYRQRRENRKD